MVNSSYLRPKHCFRELLTTLTTKGSCKSECIWLIIIAYFGFVCRSGFWNADLFLFIFRIHISWSECLAVRCQGTKCTLITLFSCDSSSMRSNVRRSVGRSVGRSVRQQRVSKFNRMIKQCIENNA